MNLRPASASLQLPAFSIVVIGILLAVATNLAVAALTPVKLAFVLGGLALLIPTIVMKNPKAYWLFLLVFSIPFDISKWFSAWLVDPSTLVDLYGQPISGITAVELYLTDIVLIAMLPPWLIRICMRRQPLYFPKVGYLFILYLLWALLVSLINAQSLYLAMFELFRQTLYFLFFLYLVNNIESPLEFRTVVRALMLGFIIGISSVIIFFELRVGTETSFFAALHDGVAAISQGQAQKPTSTAARNANLTLHGTTRRFAALDRGVGSEIVRSQGIFRHPAIPASLCGLILPIILAYLVTARTNRRRILLLTMFGTGTIGLVLTFSRAGAIGFAAGTLVFLTVAGWSRLISRRAVTLTVIGLTISAAIGIPLVLAYFAARPESVSMRFYLYQAALQGYLEHPIFGVGLNNSTAAMAQGRQDFIDLGIRIARSESADSYYLAILMEVGPIGCVLFFGFFAKIAMIAFRAMREAGTEMKPLLVGIVAGLVSLAVQSIADAPTAGHAVSASLWLFAALAVSIGREVQAGTRPAVGTARLAPFTRSAPTWAGAS